MSSSFDSAFSMLPLVAILRGITPEEAEPVAGALYEAGFRLIEVPLNSPRALDSIELLARTLPPEVLLGAGTVLSVQAATQVEAAGGRIVVMPHSDMAVVLHAKIRGLYCIPGAATPTEAFACLAAGADAVKLFPAELIGPSAVKALRAVLPPELRLLPVGGITPEAMTPFRAAGANGFGLGSALYAPGMTTADVTHRARRFVAAWRQGGALAPTP